LTWVSALAPKQTVDCNSENGGGGFSLLGRSVVRQHRANPDRENGSVMKAGLPTAI